MTNNLNIEVINQILMDTSNKNLISDGIFTLGELHSDRACLYVALIKFILKVYELKGVDPKTLLWKSYKDHEEKEAPSGYVHVGLTLGDRASNLGILLPETVTEILEIELVLDKSKYYSPLYDSLNLIN